MYSFQDPDELTAHLIGLFEDSHKKIIAAWPMARISYSELIGIDLVKSKFNSDPLPGQQDILSEGIVKANAKIVKINIRNDVPTPWISQQVHVMRKNGMHHHYVRLWDGVHYNEKLEKDCADRFVKTIVKSW